MLISVCSVLLVRSPLLLFGLSFLASPVHFLSEQGVRFLCYIGKRHVIGRPAGLDRPRRSLEYWLIPTRLHDECSWYRRCRHHTNDQAVADQLRHILGSDLARLLVPFLLACDDQDRVLDDRGLRRVREFRELPPSILLEPVAHASQLRILQTICQGLLLRMFQVALHHTEHRLCKRFAAPVSIVEVCFAHEYLVLQRHQVVLLFLFVLLLSALPSPFIRRNHARRGGTPSDGVSIDANAQFMRIKPF